MGQSTDGQICFGVLLDEDVEQPWDSERGMWDFEAWWLREQGYQPLFALYDSSGNYINGMKPSEEKIEEYYARWHAFRNAHPLPVDLIHHCSGDYPMYILAVLDTIKIASRGYPESFNPAGLNVPQSEIDKLLKFCTDYRIKCSGKPEWWLSSYWG